MKKSKYKLDYVRIFRTQDFHKSLYVYSNEDRIPIFLSGYLEMKIIPKKKIHKSRCFALPSNINILIQVHKKVKGKSSLLIFELKNDKNNLYSQLLSFIVKNKDVTKKDLNKLFSEVKKDARGFSNFSRRRPRFGDFLYWSPNEKLMMFQNKIDTQSVVLIKK